MFDRNVPVRDDVRCDDFGKEYSGLNETRRCDVDDPFLDKTSDDEWKERIDWHDDKYTGEAKIDRQAEQKRINAKHNNSGLTEEPVTFGFNVDTEEKGITFGF